MMLRFKDSPDPNMVRPGSEDKIMHSSLRVDDTAILASGGMCQEQANFEGFCAIPLGGRTRPGRAAFQRSLRWRAWADAVDQDIFRCAWLGYRSPRG
jgi:uncharacterized glyoxalase superfamily protein PhnB